MECASLHIGHHPLRIFGAAERVLVQKALVSRDAQAIHVAAAGDVDIGIESRSGFGLGELSDWRERVAEEVDGELRVGDNDVTGGLVRVIACSAPISSVLRRK